jgi:hypothetical protein
MKTNIKQYNDRELFNQYANTELLNKMWDASVKDNLYSEIYKDAFSRFEFRAEQLSDFNDSWETDRREYLKNLPLVYLCLWDGGFDDVDGSTIETEEKLIEWMKAGEYSDLQNRIKNMKRDETLELSDYESPTGDGCALITVQKIRLFTN